MTEIPSIIEINTLSPEEYIQLRIDAEWGQPDPEDVKVALENSIIVFVKRDKDKAIGCVRIVGDGKLCCYIQDLIVLKDYRKMGIGTDLMNAAMNYIASHVADNCFIGLMAGKGLDNFYSYYGFIPRPNSEMGPGMVQFFGRKGEKTEV